MMFYKVRNTLLVYRKSLKLVRNKSKLSYYHNVGKEPLRPITVGLLLEETVQKHGDNLAIVSRFQNKRLTFLAALQEADRLAAGLTKLGLQNGDRVGVWAPNIIEWYTANMACARAGFVMVALNPLYQPREIEYCINKVEMKSIICAHKHKTQDYYESLKSISPELENSDPGKLRSKNLPSLTSIVTIGEESLRGTHNYNEILDLVDADSIRKIRKNQDSIKIDDPCNIQFTSGTTGQPKAALINHFGMVNNGYFVGKRFGFGEKHHTVCLQVPFFHVFGTLGGILASLNYGSTLVLPTPGYNPNETLDTLKEGHCTIIFGTPTMYVDLVKAQNERNETFSLETAISGGAPCSPHLLKEMLTVLGLKRVKSVYGLSEITAVAFQSLLDDDEHTSTNTVGYLQDHMEAKVIDGSGNIVPIGTPGELCIRSYSTMLGYWKDEEKTKEMIDAARWLRTGDQFVLEENGYARVVGRLKEMLIRGGENIFPKEIEDVLNAHPSILEAHVIGVPHERLGEEVCACIKLNNNCNITLEEIKQFCAGTISHFKIPTVLKIFDGFPKTASGKIMKYKLVEIVGK